MSDQRIEDAPGSSNQSNDSQLTTPEQPLKWYEGISSYQWLVLLIASLGWVFDVFEGQVFVASMNDAMPQLLGANPSAIDDATRKAIASWNNYALASFLLGGAFGGVLFGILSDRIGRSKTMIITILFYSVFTCVTALANAPWQMVALRFLVAMGVGGEWAVASAMVAEVMPKRSRAVMGSIFHASSVFGTLMAVAVGYFIISAQVLEENTWRLGFVIGVLPALLTVFIRWKMREPEQWVKARERERQDATQRTGSLSDLFKPTYLRNTIVGVSLATIGLTTFWGCHIYGKDTLKRRADRDPAAVLAEAGLADVNWDSASEAQLSARDQAMKEHKSRVKQEEMTGMFLVMVLGGGLGLVLFGAISNLIGRKGAFVFYHLGGFLAAMVLFYVLDSPEYSRGVLLVFLPVFGFLTLGMHAGYAVYFPELFPTRLRGTGTGFCFNAGRIGSAAAILASGLLKWTPNQSSTYMIPLFAVGVVVTLLAKETRGEELPD
ncbi:MAG: MFS transporter [Planctomycetaceae bacterium]|nr:MFS transporter [Planctomycetaceae bacterium]